MLDLPREMMEAQDDASDSWHVMYRAKKKHQHKAGAYSLTLIERQPRRISRGNEKKSG